MLADFVAEFTPPLTSSEGICHIKIGQWKVFMNEASNVKGLEVGLVLILPKGVKLERSLRLGFRALNNEAEYEALIDGLRVAKSFGVKQVEMFSNSRPVVRQIEGSFEARDHRMSQYLRIFEILRVSFQKVMWLECQEALTITPIL